MTFSASAQPRHQFGVILICEPPERKLRVIGCACDQLSRVRYSDGEGHEGRFAWPLLFLARVTCGGLGTWNLPLAFAFVLFSDCTVLYFYGYDLEDWFHLAVQFFAMFKLISTQIPRDNNSDNCCHSRRHVVCAILKKALLYFHAKYDIRVTI